MTDPDLKLLDATGRGDHLAFELLVKKYQGPLHNFIARYVGNRWQAEEIAQEVFLRVYGAAGRFEAKTKVSTWIFRIAYNLSLTEIGRSRRRRNLCEAVKRNEGDQEPFTAPAERYELEEEITSALGRLPENQRAALLLRVNEELSYREIGDILGVSVQSVESLLFRARTSLKRDFNKRQGGTL